MRRGGQGTGADFVPANPSLAERGNAICRAVDAVPACCNQTERGGDVGTRSTSSCRCHVHQKQEQADFVDESNALSVVVDQGGHDSELTAVAAHGPRNTDAACGRSAESDNPWRPFWLPDAEISARGAVMDIVTVRSTFVLRSAMSVLSFAWFPIITVQAVSDRDLLHFQAEHQRCNCFTKTYSRYSKVWLTRNCMHALPLQPVVSILLRST